MITLNSLKSRLFLASLSGSLVLSILALILPSEEIKQNLKLGIACFVGAGFIAEYCGSKYLREIDRLESTNNKLLQDKNKSISQFEQDIKSKQVRIEKLTTATNELKTQLESINKAASNKQLEIIKQQQIVRELNQKLESIGEFTASEKHRIVRDCYKHQIKKVDCLINSLSRRYPAISEEIDNLAVEVDKFRNYYLHKINEYESIDDFDSLLDIGLELQEKIIDRSVDLRVKAQAIVINYLSLIVDDSVSLMDYERYISDLATKAKQEIIELNQFHEGNKKAIASEWIASNQEMVNRYQTEYTDTLDTAKYAVSKMEELNKHILNLESQLSESKKPNRFPGTTEQARVGNSLIDYYYKLNYCLDALQWSSDETGYKLFFHIGRNGRYFIDCDTLNDGTTDKIKELSGALNKPKFEYNNRGGNVTLYIQTRHKKKATVEEDYRLWKPAIEFEKIVSKWSRIRITGGSESGKSPTAENLAVAILRNRPGTIKLFNPQHNSTKNHWGIPVTGKTHKDSEKGIADLAKKIDFRSNGDESKDCFTLFIFDEIDSTMSHTKGKKIVIGDNVNFIIKQASHQNLGVVFIGQNANVSEYPGMSRSDWNSAVNFHIGANCYDAIENSNQFTTQQQNKLKAIADKLTAYCESKNNELGLDNTDAEAYRFGFVVEPGKKPYFINLPSFGSYKFDDNMLLGMPSGSSGESIPTSPTATLEVPHSKVSKNGKSPHNSAICPHCKTPTSKVKQRKPSAIRYQCANRDCGKSFTVKTNSK